MAKKTQKNKDVFTVKDFKMWLLGMTEFQESGWTPNIKQWNTILDKVESLEDNVQYVQSTTVNTAPNITNQSYNTNSSPPPSFDISSAHGGVGSPARRFLDEPEPARGPSYSGESAGLPSGSGIIEADITGSFV